MASAGGDWKDMFYACERGDVACVTYHLSQGVDVDYQHPEAMVSALVTAASHGHADVVKILLEHGANPNLAAQLGGLTPLQAAASQPNVALQQMLLDHGAIAVPAAKRSLWQRWLSF